MKVYEVTEEGYKFLRNNYPPLGIRGAAFLKKNDDGTFYIKIFKSQHPLAKPYIIQEITDPEQ